MTTKTFYVARVTYQCDDWFSAIIVETDAYPTHEQAIESLLDDYVFEIAFQACSIKGLEGIANPFMDGSDIEGCYQMVSADMKGQSDEDKYAYELVEAIVKWIKTDFNDDAEWPRIGRPFDGHTKEIKVHLGG